jgi:uncharacterized membrane protein
MVSFGTFLTGILLGGMLFVTVLVAPIIFIVLEDPEATRFTRTLWPRYFLINATVSLLAGAMLVLSSQNGLIASPLFLCTVLMGFNWECARRMRSMRDPGDTEEKSSYEWLHSITVWNNTLSLLLVGAADLYLTLIV